MNDKYEVIKFEDGEFSLDVSVDPSDDTVWLTQKEIGLLFNVSHATVSEHISNIFRGGEINIKTSVGFSDKSTGGRRAKLYNLDVILAVGYRVNSKRGILFRRWATSVLKQYMLRGYAINEKRCLECNASIISLQNEVKEIKQVLNDRKELMAYEGELIEPISFIRKLFFLAKHEIVVIDSYADSFLLTMIEGIKVKITIIVSTGYLNSLDVPNGVKIIHSNLFHDRYIVIDEIVYLIGTSFNDIGKKRFTIVRLKDVTREKLLIDIKINT